MYMHMYKTCSVVDVFIYCSPVVLFNFLNVIQVYVCTYIYICYHYHDIGHVCAHARTFFGKKIEIVIMIFSLSFFRCPAAAAGYHY